MRRHSSTILNLGPSFVGDTVPIPFVQETGWALEPVDVTERDTYIVRAGYQTPTPHSPSP
jgi:hypothetical protein